MKKFMTDPATELVAPGIQTLQANIADMQNGSEDAIAERFKDVFSYGIVQQAAGTPFAISSASANNITVGSGVGYMLDTVTAKSKRVAIAVGDVTVYDATLPDQKTDDNVGGLVSTPKSTGCVSIPIPDDSVTYYIGIKYLRVIDSNTPSTPTNYSLHPISSKRLFYRGIDGYEIEVKTSAILVTGLLIGTANNTGGVVTVSTSGRVYAALRPEVNLLNTLNVADGAVTNSKLGGSAVTGDKIHTDVAGNGLSKDVSQNLQVNVDNSTIVISGDILNVADGAITNSKLAILSVDTANLIDNAVSTSKIVNGAVTALKLAPLIGSCKMGSFTIDMATDSGTQVITGVGFTPSFVLFMSSSGALTPAFSIGLDDGTNIYGLRMSTASRAANLDSYSIYHNIDNTHAYNGKITTLGADGYTITWIRSNGPTGILNISYLAFK